MTTIQVAFSLPSDLVKIIDRLASSDLESRAAWARRVVLAELRKIEAQSQKSGGSR
jgi:metal-responsive CopG/Arc/MetJ family transcriptional regulator